MHDGLLDVSNQFHTPNDVMYNVLFLFLFLFLFFLFFSFSLTYMALHALLGRVYVGGYHV